MTFEPRPPMILNGKLDKDRAEFVISTGWTLIRDLPPELPDGRKFRGWIMQMHSLAKELVEDRLRFDDKLASYQLEKEKLRQKEIENLTAILALPNSTFAVLKDVTRDRLTEIIRGRG